VKKAFTNELRSRVDSYFRLVIHNARDTVPKTIGQFLVGGAQNQLQYSLYNDFIKNQELLDSIGEPPHIAEERETINKTLATLRKAQKILKTDDR